MKKINIEKKTIEIPVKIEVDGKIYPITQWNLGVVAEYELKRDEALLEKLKD